VKAVVTGGAGFIGSHLVERLLEDGLDVTVIDDFSTGRQDNLAHLAGRSQLVVAPVDLNKFDHVLPHFDGASWVFHMAALADIVPSIERPLTYHRANVDGTVAALEAARRSGVRRFVYTASSSCYGIPDVYPTPETAAIRPQYPYALTKWVGEQYGFHWGQAYGLPLVSLRLFNVYGPRSRTSGTYGAVFGVFLAQKLKSRPFTVVGDGTQTRDFVFVTDVVDAFVAAARSDVVGACFNVGSGRPVSVNRLVELLEGPAVHVPKRPGEPDRTHADIRAIEAALGWKPRVSFEDGVKVMREHITYWGDAPVWTPETIEQATRAWFQHLGR
jgi:UDP-glucose 4-epimerase